MLPIKELGFIGSDIEPLESTDSFKRMFHAGRRPANGEAHSGMVDYSSMWKNAINHGWELDAKWLICVH